jgi:ferritin-like metal-binding protein YciE
MNTLKSLFLNELAEMYDAERRITQALPKLIQAATCSDVQQALRQNLKETEAQAGKVEKIFAAFNEKPRAKKCPAMAGLIEEAEAIASENKKSPTINAAIIAAAQKIEHYEIASYGCLHAWADFLEKPDAVRLLEEVLDEEKRADKALNELAASKNQEAFEEVEVGAGGGAV